MQGIYYSFTEHFKKNTEIALSPLRADASVHLPEYMIPSKFVFLEALPLTPHGKVNREALPEPGEDRTYLESEFVPPTSDIEVGLATIWSEVLGNSNIGIHDNFFNIGGHSLLAARVITRIQNKFTLQIPLRVLFEHPTILGQANYIEEELKGEEETESDKAQTSTDKREEFLF